MKYGLIKAVMIVLFVTLCGCNKHNEEDALNNETVPVKALKIEKEIADKPIYASGQFTTDDETFLSFKTGGIIKAIFVSEGQQVKAGQVLAVLDLREIQAEVDQAKLGYEKALRDYNRASNLYKDSVATRAQMEDAKTGLDVSSHQLNIAKFNLRFSEIRAVANGYILKKFANPGQMVGPGSPVFQTNGASKGNWFLKVGVSDNEWSSIKIGDRATVRSDISQDASYSGVVAKKSEAIDPVSGTFIIDIKLKEKLPVQLASGLFGKAEIIPSGKYYVWSAPYESILDGDGNTGYVFVTNDMKKAKKVKVVIADILKNKAYVSSGLENYSYIITSGSAYLKDGIQIKVEN